MDSCLVCYDAPDYKIVCKFCKNFQCGSCFYKNEFKCCFCKKPIEILEALFTPEIPFNKIAGIVKKYLKTTNDKTVELVGSNQMGLQFTTTVINLLVMALFKQLTTVEKGNEGNFFDFSFQNEEEIFSTIDAFENTHRSIVKGLVLADKNLISLNLTILLDLCGVHFSGDYEKIFFSYKDKQYYGFVKDLFKIKTSKHQKYVKIRALNMCFICKRNPYKLVDKKKYFTMFVYEKETNARKIFSVGKNKLEFLKVVYILALFELFDVFKKNQLDKTDKCVCNKFSCKECNRLYCEICFGLLENHDETKCDKPEDFINYKLCPNCKILQYKDGGCDDMWCPNCKTFFSWDNQRFINSLPHNPNAMSGLYEKNFGSDFKETIFMDTVSSNKGFCNFFPDKLVEIHSNVVSETKKKAAFVNTLKQLVVTRVLEIDSVFYDEGSFFTLRNFETYADLIDVCKRYREIIVSVYSQKDYKRWRRIYAPMLTIDTFALCVIYEI